MFGNLNKPTFGSPAANTSFGFSAAGTTNANPFGQSQLFGKPATGGFGSPSTSTFGQPATASLFPSTQAQPTNIFQNANTSFGAPPTSQPGFGATNLFGQQQPASGGLFSSASTFGQQNKPTGFGFGTPSTQPSLFGQQQPAQTSSLFQPSTGSTLFGGTSAFGGQQQAGTVIKFNPVTSTDTMMKNGTAQNINTKHMSITCMKEYENKSFEELRYEDYMANRKGPQQTGFGATPFGTTVSSAPSLFGQPDASKPAFGQTPGFGQTTSTFGQTTGFGLGQQQQQTSLFGKPAGFGAPTSSTSTFGFATAQNANPFGTNQPKPFGSTAQPIFGTNTSTTQSGFGTGLFGQTSTQSTAGSLFGKPTQPTAGFGSGQTAGFPFNTPASTQATGLFSQNKPLFGQPTTNTGFGQTSGFGATSTTPFGSTFAKPATPAFGATQATGFGTTLGTMQPQGTSLFGNTAAKPGGLFGSTGTTGLFGNTNTTFQPTTGFGLQPQQPQQSLFLPAEQQSMTNLALLTTDPFGDAPHLAGLEPKLKSDSQVVSATDPKELKSLLDASKKVDTSSNSKLKIIPIKSVRDSLFDGISPKCSDNARTEEYVKTNCRRLVLKHRPSSGGDGVSKTDILKHISFSDDNKENKTDANRNDLNMPNDAAVVPLRLNFDSTVDDHGFHETQFFDIGGSKNKNFIDRNNSFNPDFDDDEDQPVVTSDSSSIQKKYPCGIICTRPEYYTLPSLEDLSQYLDENGRCIVKGFTIGRKGYGNVYFADEIDVAGLNIDELVHFRYREINVYPDDLKKPPVGQGLNRKAQITLDNVYPRRSDTNALIKDVGELLQMNFAEKLRKITVKKDAKFVDYRPETGSWVFKVDHFSRYGFNDSDEESETSGQEAAGKKVAEGAQKLDALHQTQTIKTVEELAKLEALKKKEKTREQEVSRLALEDGIFLDGNDHFPQHEDVLHQSAYIDNMSVDEYHGLPPQIPIHFPYDPFKTSKSIQVMKSSLFAEDDRSSDGGGSHMSIIRQYLDLPEEMARLPLMREEMLPKKKLLLRPKVDKVHSFGDYESPCSVIPCRNYQDLGAFKSKSFKVGWTKGFGFYTLDTEAGFRQINVSELTSSIQKTVDPLQECLSEALGIVLDESSFKLDSNRIPTFKINQNYEYLKKQVDLFSDISSKYAIKDSQYLYSIWTLAEALWGPGENSISNRRYLLSKWLKDCTNFEEKPTNKTALEIFNYLTVFKIEEASSKAIDKRWPNLALLISQLSVTNTTKLFLQQLIDNWYDSLVSNHIDEVTKKIYLLLSGIPLKSDVNIFENIDWKRAFGMHLWYISPLGSPIETAIELYRRAFEEEGYAEVPTPPYVESFKETMANDVLYHMLLLYKARAHRLSTVLNPATHTNNYLDYRLSWLLLQLFLSLDIGIIEKSEINKLCVSFSNQLEAIGEWQWAIFALLYLDDNALKKNLILGILDRNLTLEIDEDSLAAQDILVNRMQIPSEWIHKVKGEKMMLFDRHYEAFNHLTLSGNYCRANDILVEHLLPNLFINEQYDIIKQLISEIRDGAGDILHWNNQAGLFSDFLELQEKTISSKTEDQMRLHIQIQSIGDRLANFVLTTEQQKLCIAEMSKRCASVFKELCKKSQSDLIKNVYGEFVETLIMPPDFKRNEALYLINEFYNTRT